MAGADLVGGCRDGRRGGSSRPLRRGDACRPRNASPAWLRPSPLPAGSKRTTRRITSASVRRTRIRPPSGRSSPVQRAVTAGSRMRDRRAAAARVELDHDRLERLADPWLQDRRLDDRDDSRLVLARPRAGRRHRLGQRPQLGADPVRNLARRRRGRRRARRRSGRPSRRSGAVVCVYVEASGEWRGSLGASPSNDT